MLLYQMQNFDTIIDRSTTNAEKYTKRQKLFGTDDVLPMWVADMDLPSPACVIDALHNRLKHPILGYEEMPSSALSAQIAWIQEHYDITVESKDIFVSPSVVTSMNIAIEAFSEMGDEIIVQPPIYPPFMHSVKHHNRVLVLNPLKNVEGQYQMDLEDLESKITPKTKILLLCSPHNPTGRVWSQNELETLLAITQKHNIVIVSDEVHSDLVYKPHTPLYKLSQNVVALQGVGKSFNLSGMAISTVIIQNQTLKEQFEKVYQQFHLGEGNCLSQLAFEVAYQEGKEWLEELLKYIPKNFKLLEALAQKYPNQMQFKQPDGTYLAWIDFRGLGISDKALERGLIEHGLGLSLGRSFGKGGRGFMRMNCAVPHSVMQEALKRLEAFLFENLD